MRPWKEVIAEARDRNKEKAEQERRKKIAKTALKGSAALKQEKKGSKKTGPSPEYLELAQQREKRKAAQFSWTKERAEKNKAEQLKKLKERESASHKERAKQAIADIKPERISSKEGEASAYTKVVGNVGSLAGGLTKAAIHGARYAASKRKEKADASKETKIPEKKERKSGILGGRPSRPKPTASPSAAASSASASSAPEPKKLVPATKRLQPAGGLAQGRPKAKTLGQRARQNPKIRAGLIAQRMEEFSNWREEFIVEVEGEKSKEKKEKIVDVMRGKNKIEINPNIKEERDEEGGMAHNELATVERAVKSLRKKIKSPNQQLPAWVQSKISKAADYIDTVADYMMGETEKVTEAYDDETFRQHSRETFSSHTPSESRSRTASVLKKMKEMNVNVEKSKKKKKKKTVAEECGCMDDKKKVLATAIFKKALSDKKKKNFQLNSGIIGEEKTAAWQRKEGKNPEGGLNKKGIASYRRENPGSKLSMAVTTPPSKLDPDSKAAKRRKSFCARMGGMPGPMKDEKGRPTRKALSLRKWNC